jgi:hypothetical protein
MLIHISALSKQKHNKSHDVIMEDLVEASNFPDIQIPSFT